MKSAEVLIALKCPSCAGPLSVAEGDTCTTCPNCASSLILPGSIRSYVLPSEIPGTQALRTVRKKLESINSKAAGRSRVSSPVLFYVPYWRIRCQASGYVLGADPVYREKEIPIISGESTQQNWSVMQSTAKRKTRTGTNAVEREIQITGSVNISGADLTPLGIPSLSSKAQMSLQGMAIHGKGLPDGLQVLDFRNQPEGVFVDPTVSLPEAGRQAEEYVGRLASAIGRGLRQRWEFSVITGRRNCLIYYPLWVISYECDRRTFQTVVDGRSGQVLRGRFPGKELDRRYFAAGIGALWAGLLPGAVDLVTGINIANLVVRKTANCYLIIIMFFAGLAVGTWKLLQILDTVGDSGGDHVI